MLVLTYHSISDAGGPTSIPPAVFAMQMEALAEAGYRSQTLDGFLVWHEGGTAEDRQALITFDDAFADFAEGAFPVLQRHGYSALVFVPTQRLGKAEAWIGANDPARPLMDWEQVRSLASRGIEFGGHSRTHTDLTTLDSGACEQEIAGCADDLAERIGRPVESFAAPYGHVSPAVVSMIGRYYRAGFGTRFALARPGLDRFDLPRIEMHYFRRRSHWAGFLAGRRGYFRLRQGLRAARALAGGGIG